MTTYLSPIRALALAEGLESGSEEELIQAWQYLHDSRLAYSLQGSLGRTAERLVAEGVIQA